MDNAFTLLELLAVVLIIGILAAIAVPQYQKAVEKARFTEAVMAVEEIAHAQDLYKMDNGNYTRDINDLDISFTGEDGYYGKYPAKLATNFQMVATNKIGEQTTKARTYSITISINNIRGYNLYSGVNDYAVSLCKEWSFGRVSDLRSTD